MYLRRSILAVMIGLLAAVLGATSAAAANDLPRTFVGCVVQGGDVRKVGGEITCRLIRSDELRVYGTATDECGEEIELEIWSETRDGVVTFFLASGRTVVLPEVVTHYAWERASASPISCMDD